MSNINGFTPTINSDNRFDFLKDCRNGMDDLVIGGSCTHIYDFPFIYSDFIKSGTIYYKQGLDFLLEIPIENSMITECEDNGVTLITLNLGPLQTQVFNKTVLDTFSQIKLITKSDKVLYSNKYYINVVKPLKVDRVVGQ